MDRDCMERLEKITQGFRECRKAFTAIGDETQWKAIADLTALVYEGIKGLQH